MNILFRNDLYKQAAMLMLCGLLPYFCLAQPRSRSEAEKVMNNFISKNIAGLKMADLKLSLTSSQILPGRGLRLGKEAYYIYSSAKGNTGFVIVSEENNFNTDSIPPNVRYWLECYAESFQEVSDNGDCMPMRLTSVNADGIDPLLGDNQWDQDDPYNRLCPSVRNEKCLTGCVATAMSQVMFYHKYPVVGKGYINYRTESNGIQIKHDLGSVYFKWDDMLNDYKREYSSAQADAIAELMFACGITVHMDYGTIAQKGSGAYQSDLIPAFIENFGYDNDAAFITRGYCSTEDWHRILINELNEGRPINYGGQSTRDGGHSFVLDGYRVNEGNKYPDYHVNWGWNGSCNGYYQIADLHPKENGQHATMGGFNNSQQMTIGIKPDDGFDDGTYYLCTPNLYASMSAVKAGSTIQIYTASCANFSYKEFNGTLHVALIPSDGSDEVILGEYKVRALSYMQEQNNVSIEITLPTTLSDGQYTVQLRSRQSRSTDYNQVFSKKYPEINISENGSVKPNIIEDAMLGSSEIELGKTSTPSLICLNIYELQNLLESPFIGDLKMILADKYGNQICSFGDSIQPGELSMYEIQEDPLKIQGKLIGNWPDGDYKIYVGARLINTTSYVYISYYDIAQPDMNYQELCLNAKIENGNIIINGRTFIISPTAICNTQSAPAQNSFLWRIDGKRIVDSSKFGIYIIKKSDGTVIKFMSD